MKNDRNDALERLQKELLAAEPEEDILEEAMTLSEPAFEDPDAIGDPKEPDIYRNFSNDYGRKVQAQKEPMSRGDKVDMGLMIAISALSLGIVGVLVYGLIKFW